MAQNIYYHSKSEERGRNTGPQQEWETPNMHLYICFPNTLQFSCSLKFCWPQILLTLGLEEALLGRYPQFFFSSPTSWDLQLKSRLTSQLHTMTSLGLHAGAPLTHTWAQCTSYLWREILQPLSCFLHFKVRFKWVKRPSFLLTVSRTWASSFIIFT